MKRPTIFIAVLLATTACTQSATTPVAGSAIGVDVAGIDKAVKPGDDFDSYANGGWRAKTEIPADRSSTGIFLQVFNVAEGRNAALIAEAAKANAAAGTDQRRIADYYTAFLDTAGMSSAALRRSGPSWMRLPRSPTSRRWPGRWAPICAPMSIRSMRPITTPSICSGCS